MKGKELQHGSTAVTTRKGCFRKKSGYSFGLSEKCSYFCNRANMPSSIADSLKDIDGKRQSRL